MGSSRTDPDRQHLETLYERYNHRSYVGSDPIGFLYGYDAVEDREIVGLLAATIAYGRVAQIARSMSTLLERLPEPSRALREMSARQIARAFAGFRHRFTSGEEIARLLWGTRCLREECGTLEAALTRGQRPEDGTIESGLTAFVESLRRLGGLAGGHVLPSPADGSACKRLNLFLRWMVRRDAVDPGGWVGISPTRLVVPLDVHMHRIALGLGLTRRRSADWKTALEVTAGFRARAPEDPARYDFALTRLGIRAELRLEEALAPMWCGA
jgi:uncharacterized protein (TIGR02757 family)